MTVLKPSYQVIYESVNVTADLLLYSASITYENSLENESADLQIKLIDWDGKWSGDWSPAKGDKISVILGYENGIEIDCGGFEVDTIRLNHDNSGRSVEIAALATPFSAALRELRNVEYENVTLDGIARAIAQRHGLEVVGSVPSVTFKRQTQSDTDDLAFLRRLCEEYDLLVKVENGQLIFYSHSELDSQASALTLTLEDIANFSLEDSLDVLYRSVELTYQDPESQETIESTDSSIVDSTAEKRADVLRLNLRVEDKAQADLIAQGKLRQANANKLTGQIELAIGRPDLDAGINITLDVGSSVWSGDYQIARVSHQVNGSAFQTSIEVRRLYRQ